MKSDPEFHKISAVKVKNLVLLFFFLAILIPVKAINARIVFNIIGKGEEVDSDFIQNLKRYIPEFEYSYYNYKEPEIEKTFKALSFNYLPFIFYADKKLNENDWKILNNRHLIEKKDSFYIFPFQKLHYLTSVRLLNRKVIPSQLGLFVMSHCPYAKRAEWRIIKFIKENNLPITIKLYFIGNIKDGKISSMHGPDEVEEDMFQLLIEKYWPEKLNSYLLNTETMGRIQALNESGIPVNKLIELMPEGRKLLKENLKVGQKLKIYASPTFLWENVELISGLDKIMKNLEQEKEEIYKKTHPLVEYLIIGLKDYESSSELFKPLKEKFRLKGSFIPYGSPLVEKYRKDFKFDFLPFIFIKKKASPSLNQVLEEKLKNYRKREQGYVIPAEEVIEISPLYFLNRRKIENRVDIIARAKDLKKIKNSSFINTLLNSGIKVNFHPLGLFSRPRLYKELDINRGILILWENQYLFSNFVQLLGVDEIKRKFTQLKAERKVMLDFFESPSCKFCRYVKEKVLPEVRRKYKNLIDIIEFNTLDGENYELLLKMENYFKGKKPGIPKIFIAGKVLVGKNEIEKKLEMEILNALIGGERIFKVKKPLKIECFFNSDYLKKEGDERKLYYEIIPALEKRYQGEISIEKYDIVKKANLERMLKLIQKIGNKEDYKTLKLFIRGKIYSPEQIKENADRIIQENLLLTLSSETGTNLVSEKLSKYTLPAVIFAGLLDGINPCAFTVIVFFISFLSFAGYRKREMFNLGSTFIFAVFLAYFLIGLGLFSAFYNLKIYKWLTQSLRYLIIIVVFLLGGLNLYDYLIYKIKRTPGSTFLQLPQRIKFLIQKVIGKAYRRGESDEKKTIFWLLALAFVVGFVVSILESVCTGQVYFPTIAFVAQLPGMARLKALNYLFIYNLAFILPLIIIFLLGLYGVSSQQFARFVKLHIGKIKLLTSFLFFFLGYILIALY